MLTLIYYLNAGWTDGDGGALDKSAGWTEHTAPEGYVYYYNARSGVSQWERPMELDFPMSQN